MGLCRPLNLVAQRRRTHLEPLDCRCRQLDLVQDVELGMELEAHLVASLEALIRKDSGGFSPQITRVKKAIASRSI